MSETVHYKGKLIKVKTDDINEFIDQVLTDRKVTGDTLEYYNDKLDCFKNEFYEEYYYNDKDGSLYKILHEDCPYNEVISAYNLDDSTIAFELLFYNGGASFNECLDEAVQKLNTDEF